jgi:hypothetical protein
MQGLNPLPCVLSQSRIEIKERPIINGLSMLKTRLFLLNIKLKDYAI